MATPTTSVSNATPGQITSSSPRVLRKLAIKVLRPVGVRGRKGRRR